MRQLHTFTGQFESIKHLRQVLVSEMNDDLPLHYNIGYYEGRHHTKRWLTTDKDVIVMNETFPDGNVIIWCDAQEEARERSPSRRNTSSKREEKENDVDDIVQDLKSRHGSDYSGPQLRLWARMISNGVYDDKDDPPRVPMIVGTPKKKRPDSLTDALLLPLLRHSIPHLIILLNQ